MKLRTFAMLISGHLLADGPLQPRWLSDAKGRRWEAMALHACVHGAAVVLATGQPALGVAEAIAHATTDKLKRAGRLTVAQDQTIHVLHKLVWWLATPERDAAAAGRPPAPRQGLIAAVHGPGVRLGRPTDGGGAKNSTSPTANRPSPPEV